MNHKMIGSFAIFAIILVTVISVNINISGDNLSSFSLKNIEALAQEINYYVPDMSNDPKKCTLEVYFEAGAEYEPGKFAASAGYKRVSGMENFCQKGSAGCDPYNCHRRV